MKFSKTNSLVLIGVLLIIAAVAVSISIADRRMEKATTVGETSQVIPQRDSPRRIFPAPLEHADVVKMTPKDWAKRFRESPSEVSAEYEEEIVSLAEELEEILKQNPDPNGEDALIFGEAMLTLLEEGRTTE